MTVHLSLELGTFQAAVDQRLSSWDAASFGTRLWARDGTLWSADPVPELTDRLGWLDLPTVMEGQLADLDAFGAELADEGFTHAVVLGMGGSSLAPEVYQATFGNAEGHPQLLVLDSTHPASVQSVAGATNPATTLYFVSSKSGGTLETLSFFRYFWARTGEVTDNAGRHFVAVTDPESSLAELAQDRGFRRTFLAPPDVGGRYSALTAFGLVPAAAIGTDLAGLQRSAAEVMRRCGPDVAVAENPGLQLGATLGELALAGRDKVTFVASARLHAFPAWIEQLIAESTGKADKGIVPVGGEPLAATRAYGADRVFVHLAHADDDADDITSALERLAAADHPIATITLDDSADIAGAMFLLEVAVASAGAVLEIHPFNQPDVQLAKELAKQAMAGDLAAADTDELEALSPDLPRQIAEWLATIAPGDYLGIHAYLPPEASTRDTLQDARIAIRDGLRVATTLDFGPRFLHSTGQLHKGGPNTGAFIQVIDHPQPFVAVPETDFDFGKLVSAQAMGDHQALVGRSRRILQVCIGESGERGLAALNEAIHQAVDGSVDRDA